MVIADDLLKMNIIKSCCEFTFLLTFLTYLALVALFVYALLSAALIFRLLTKVHCAALLLAFSCLEAIRGPLLLEKGNRDHEKFFNLFYRFAHCLNLFLHEEHVGLLLLSFEFWNLCLIFILIFFNSVINSLLKFRIIPKVPLFLLSIQR